MGFLTDIKPTEVLFKLDQVLKGEYQLDRRFLLEMEIRSKGESIYDAIALNDVVLHSGRSVHMIDFELNIDGQYVYRHIVWSLFTPVTAYLLVEIVHPWCYFFSDIPCPIVVGGHRNQDYHS